MSSFWFISHISKKEILELKIKTHERIMRRLVKRLMNYWSNIFRHKREIADDLKN